MSGATRIGTADNHLGVTLNAIDERKSVPATMFLDGHDLTFPILKRFSTDDTIKVKIAESAVEKMKINSKYLSDVLESNKQIHIYGLNTGFGGSANVRTKDAAELQHSLIKFLNVGFGKSFDSGSVKSAMIVRVNSLSRAYSGVSARLPIVLAEILNHNIIPAVPMRGSISASGDLIPLSYIGAVVTGRGDIKVFYNGRLTTCKEAFAAANLKSAILENRDGLAIVNGTSFTVGIAAPTVYDANIAFLLTQTCTALAVEAMHGTTESFHPLLNKCLPHVGQKEVAANLYTILKGSKLAVHCLDMKTPESNSHFNLKQDRYALRSSPQWLGPVAEILKDACRKINVELQGVSDNPVIDHRSKRIINGANFQGETLSITLDQMRQVIGVCGKLLFAHFSEIVNDKLNNNLTPNVTGTNFNVDFGFKGADIAMASYMSELDHLVNPISNHVLSAELHNQSVNSLALISARLTKEALEILQMMLANHLCLVAQAVDLRFLQKQVMTKLKEVTKSFSDLAVITTKKKWYEFVVITEDTKREIQSVLKEEFAEAMFAEIQIYYKDLCTGKQVIDAELGQGKMF